MKLSTLIKGLGIFAVAAQNVVPELKAQQTFPNFTMCNGFNKTGNAILSVYGQGGRPIALIGETICEEINGNQCARTSQNTTSCSVETELLATTENAGEFILDADGAIDGQFNNGGNVYSCTEQLDKDTFMVVPSVDYSCTPMMKL